MNKYIFYLRDQEGTIQRMTNLIVAPPEGLMGIYKHDQSLENFPEKTVFWENEKGFSIGIAPLEAESQQSPTAKYVPYVRSSYGHIERLIDNIYSCSDEQLALFPHEEALSGWPESRVFWAEATGMCVGIAPTIHDMPTVAPRWG